MKTRLALLGLILSSELFAGNFIKSVEYQGNATVQIDAIHDIKAATLDPASPMEREFIVSLIPISESARKATNKSVISPNQTNIGNWIILNTSIGKIRTYTLANMTADTTDARVQMYKYFTIIGGLKFGYDYTLFLNQKTIATTLDFEGPNATDALRVGQISYNFSLNQNNSIIIGIEDLKAEITSPIDTYSINKTPNIVAKYSLNGERGSFELIGLYRQINAEGEDNFVKYESKLNAYAAAIATSVNLGNDNLIFVTHYGSGISSYIEDTSGFNLDAAVVSKSDNDLKLIDSFTAYMAFKHFWTNSIQSNITYSYVKLNSDFIDPDVYLSSIEGIYKTGQYSSINIIKSFDSGLSMRRIYVWTKGNHREVQNR